ncbi:MAG: DUF721 domain-containing protein [Puniceicoccales bacterium]|jgi:hypothetical protein|nr:DUF721 domain-containing protein [Puniceicoccales bacterium]
MAAKKFNAQQRGIIAEFCGISGASTSPTLRVPDSLRIILSKTLVNVAQNFDRLKLMRRSWRSIAGAKMASFSQVKNFIQPTLTIEVTNGAVLQELKFNERKLLNAFAADWRMKCVKKMKFIFTYGDDPGKFPS